MKNELKFVAKSFYPKKLVEPVSTFLDKFDANVLNILVLSGYLAIFAEILAIRYNSTLDTKIQHKMSCSYIILRAPIVVLNTVISIIMKVMVVALIGAIM